MTLIGTQGLLFAAVLNYVVKKPPQMMYHWTAAFARHVKQTIPQPINRRGQRGFWGPSNMLGKKLWNSPVIKSVSSCPNLYSALPFPGQGLRKNAVKVDISPRMKRFVENQKRNQEWGRQYFPIFPDVLNYLKFTIITSSGILLGWIFYPDFVDRDSAINDPSLEHDPHLTVNAGDHSPMIRLYMSLPWRAMSRAWGRFNSFIEIPVFLRPYFFGLFGKMYNVNFDEAVDPDLKNYSNFSEFFRRPIKSSVRPVDTDADLVSPSDGKILHFGKIVNGTVEQVKGVTYSLQKFLGPLHFDPTHNEWGTKEKYRHNWSTVPLSNYAKALLHNPEENDLYHCVIYLAPGDYHRFHSPTNWVVQHRRHFPGDLLSVNPKLASIVPSLFVLNERVALMGKWKYGFFSMTAVGATNVGSVDIYGDITLKTNRPKRVHGAYYDATYDDVPAKKGIGMGEFNLGSTIVLIFEAPKDFRYVVKPNEQICYGRALQEVQPANM